MYEVAVKTKGECTSECGAKNIALYSSYDWKMASFWKGLVDTCIDAYTESGKISQDNSGNSVNDEMLDDEDKKIENTNACFFYRGAQNFDSELFWSPEYYASKKSCTNFCREATMVG